MIIVHAWYPELVSATIQYLNKFWPGHPAMTVLSWQPHRLEVAAPVVYLPDNKNYASNMMRFLDQQPVGELIIPWMEDYVLRTPVDTQVYQEAVALFEDPLVGCVRLRRRFCPQDTACYSRNLAFREIPKSRPYALSLQVAIWRTRVFRSLLRAGENSWRTEVNGSRRAKRSEALFLGTTRECVEYYNVVVKERPMEVLVGWLRVYWDAPADQVPPGPLRK